MFGDFFQKTTGKPEAEEAILQLTPVPPSAEEVYDAAARKVVSRLARGSVSLQQGCYQTKKQAEAEEESLRNYVF